MYIHIFVDHAQYQLVAKGQPSERLFIKQIRIQEPQHCLLTPLTFTPPP